MSSSQLFDDFPTTMGDWRELASRAGDGLEIALLWSQSADRVKVTVFDERLGESFDLDIVAADALSAFYHPFAYVASPRRAGRSPRRIAKAASRPTYPSRSGG